MSDRRPRNVSRRALFPRRSSTGRFVVAVTGADVLTAAEASRLPGIPRSTPDALARRNELPARQIGRR